MSDGLLTPNLVMEIAEATEDYRVTPSEFQQIMGTMTSIVVGFAITGVAGMLIKTVTKEFARQTPFEVKEIAGIPLPVPEYQTQVITEVRPAYTVTPGIYPWEFVGLKTPHSASHATLYASILKLPPLANFQWKYTQVPLRRIAEANKWYETMAKYLYYSPEEIDRLVAECRLPLVDFATLSNEGQFYLGRPLSPREKREACELFGDWLKRNIPRCEKIRDELVTTGTYYPPILNDDYSTLNGAHRIATLLKEFGPGFKVWAWVRV